MRFKEIISSLDNKEKRIILYLSLVVIFITALPYFFGYLRTPEGTSYSGIHALAPGDFNVYYSYLEQTKQGNFIFQDLYTSEKQDYPYLQPFWLLIGLFSKVFGLPNWIAVQLSRLLLIPLFIFVAYLFISYLFSEKQKRKIAIIFLVFSSGAGALLSPILEPGKYIAGGYYHWPMDLWVPESISFLSLYHLPHILASSILFLLVFLFLLLAFENNLYRYSILAGITLLIWLWFHPFHFFTIFLVIVVYLFVMAIIKKKIQLNLVKHSLVIICLSIPAVIYHVILQIIDPLTAGRTAQNILTTPVPWMLLISYGILGCLAVLGFFLAMRKEKKEKLFFIGIWFIVQLLLLYSPLAFQRRLSQNFHFPVTILAVLALFFLYQYFARRLSAKSFELIFRNKILFVFLFIIFFAFSNIYALTNDVLLYKNRSYSYFYLDRGYLEAMYWLKNNIGPADVVLSEGINGNFIPGIAGKKVYLGHGVETINYLEKLEKVSWFFAENSENNKREFLQRENISHIFYSEGEKKLGNFNPKNKEYLKEVFSNKEVTIYQFID